MIDGWSVSKIMSPHCTQFLKMLIIVTLHLGEGNEEVKSFLNKLRYLLFNKHREHWKHNIHTEWH